MGIDSALFKRAFEAAFKINRHTIKWNTNQQRTSHMVSHIYRTIADYLDLSVEYEHKSIDTVFYPRDAKQPDDRIIQVAVEHENNPNVAHNELNRLANSFNYPLNVIITYTWDGMQEGKAVNPNFHSEWFAKRFGGILASCSSAGQFLIIVPKDVISDEQIWYYYLYDNGAFTQI